MWSRIQSFFILVALIITAAELALAVQNRELAHKALGIANEAIGVAKNASVIATNKVSLSCTLRGYPDALQFNQVEANVTRLQKGLANLTGNVHELQSKTQVLESESASATANPGGHPDGGGSSGVRNIPEVALGWILVEGVVILLL